MGVRNQFTFYRAFYTGACRFPEPERTQILMTIIEYALYGTVKKKLTGAAAGMFYAAQPYLDSARRKAEAYLEDHSAANNSSDCHLKAKTKRETAEFCFVGTGVPDGPYDAG